MRPYFMDFAGLSFKTSKLKNDINYIKYKFSHWFEKVCRGLNMYYSKIKIIILKKKQPCLFESFKKILYGLVGSVKIAENEPLDCASYPLLTHPHMTHLFTYLPSQPANQPTSHPPVHLLTYPLTHLPISSTYLHTYYFLLPTHFLPIILPLVTYLIILWWYEINMWNKNLTKIGHFLML
jgi:hypothetical protein